jgi:hypothetical protein
VAIAARRSRLISREGYDEKAPVGQIARPTHFFLNPYDDLRFSICPQCEKKTRQRKLPLLIWVNPHYPIALNITCKNCPDCDLLIAHHDQVENHLLRPG